ncbi:hypothetical protein ACWF94_06440 [Streptomyces sp. NPDC055078]
MHAKFEIGMELGRIQATSLVDLCTRLGQEAFFAQVTEGPGRAPDPPVFVETADGKRRFGQFRFWHTTGDGRREADVLCRLSADLCGQPASASMTVASGSFPASITPKCRQRAPVRGDSETGSTG